MSQDVFVIRMVKPDNWVWERWFLTKEAVARDILTGDIGDHADEIAAILLCNPEEKICDDLTKDIAQGVAILAEGAQVCGSGGVTQKVYDFVHDWAGAGWARGLQIIDRTFTAAA